jgi:hypothetical protein
MSMDPKVRKPQRASACVSAKSEVAVTVVIRKMATKLSSTNHFE